MASLYFCQMPVEAVLEELRARLAQGESPESLYPTIEAHYLQLLETDSDERLAFEEAIAPLAEGIFIPNLFWIYLQGFLQNPEDYRPFLEYLLLTFAQLPPNPTAQKRLKPLLYVYFSQEEPFHLKRLWDRLEQEANLQQMQYFQQMRALTERNPLTTDTFRRKFSILGEYLPNFDQLFLPLPQLKRLYSSAS